MHKSNEIKALRGLFFLVQCMGCTNLHNESPQIPPLNPPNRYGDPKKDGSWHLAHSN